MKNILLLGMLYAISSLGVSLCASDELGLDVASDLPLEEATRILSEQLHCTITYESPPILYKKEMVQLFPGSNLFFSKTQNISYDYKITGDKKEIIQGLLDKSYERGDTERYILKNKGEIFHVIPQTYKSRKGKLLVYSPPLDTPVTMHCENQSIWKILGDLSAMLSKEKYDFIVMRGSVPTNAFRNTYMTLNIVDKRAREVLNQILTLFNQEYRKSPFLGGNTEFTWQLMFGTASTTGPKPTYYISYSKMSLQNPNSMKMFVMDDRPMAKAAKILEKRYNTIIIYEDPLYECPCDLLIRENTIRLAGGIIEFNWNVRDRTDDTLSDLIANRITPRPNLNVFALKRQNEIYYIYPKKYNNEEGDLEPYQSMMNQEISFRSQAVSGLDFLRQFCSEVSFKVNQMIVLAAPPNGIANKLKQHQFSEIIIEEQQAGAALTQILHKIEKDISWQLLYDPTAKQFKLTLHEVGF